MPMQFPLRDYIQARSLLKELHQDRSKIIPLFKQTILELKKPILFSALLNDFLISLNEEYLSHINTISTIFRYCIQYNNIYAFRLMLSLPRQDLILQNVLDLNKQETILMLVALYGDLNIFDLTLDFFAANIHEQNILGETVLHYAIKNCNHFNKEKIIDYLLQCGAEQDLPYDETISVREKILQLKAIGQQKINFIFCYKQHCLNNTETTKYHLAKLCYNPIKNIFRMIG